MPLNFQIGGTEIPVGPVLITITLFALAVINVVTKKVATISGVSFTIAFFIVFEFSEKYNRRHTAAHSQEMEKFSLNTSEESRRKRRTCGRATCSWRCATPTAWSTCSACWRRPIRAASTSWCSRSDR